MLISISRYLSSFFSYFFLSSAPVPQTFAPALPDLARTLRCAGEVREGRSEIAKQYQSGAGFSLLFSEQHLKQHPRRGYVQPSIDLRRPSARITIGDADRASRLDEPSWGWSPPPYQGEIWTIAGTIARDAPTAVSAQLLASLNETFDLSLTQRRAFGSRVPTHVLRLLMWASLLAVAALGFHLGMLGSRQSAMSTLLILMWASSIVLISDINRAGHGWVEVSVDPLSWTVEQLQQSAR